MKNLEKLFGDVLEATAGVRRPSYREGGNETPFELRCSEVARMIGEHREELLRTFGEKVKRLPDSALLPNQEVIDMITGHLVPFVEQKFPHLPQAERDIILRFQRPAVEAVSYFAFAFYKLSPPLRPQELYEKKPLVLRASEILAGYPQQISANFRAILGRHFSVAMSGDDLDPRFADETKRILVEGISGSAKDSAEVKKLRYCPAHNAVSAFAETSFSLFHEAYRGVHERHADETGNVPRETMSEIILRKQFEALADLL